MTLSESLLNWYDANRRSLPWRGTRDPYAIWLSEIMLQQTRTETVCGYYARFLEHFPDVHALADAPEEEVLKLWEGLGYYSRARNLHAAARRVSRELGGRFPDTVEGLRALPGVGPYAANAIASIAYGACAPALDGNQARVLSRVLAWDAPIRTPFDLLEPAQAWISRERPGDYNQALMDLGARVCLPRQPRCEACPLADACRARAEDAVEDYPIKPAPIPKKEQQWTIVLARCRGGIAVRRRPAGLLGGLYEFCPVEGWPETDALEEALAAMGFEDARVVGPLPPARHMFTHRIWRMRGFEASCTAVPEGFRLVAPQELSALPFPSALRVYLEIAETPPGDA